MNHDRIRREIEDLQDLCRDVDYYPRNGEVYLRDYPFPDGWKPEHGDILYDLPPNYPRTYPKAYVPIQLRYYGDLPTVPVLGRLYGAKTHLLLETDRRGWHKFCLRENTFDEGWQIEDTLTTVTRVINDAMEHPTANEPTYQRR